VLQQPQSQPQPEVARELPRPVPDDTFSVSVTEEAIQRSVAKWMTQNAASLKGRDGKDGENGKDGKDGSDGIDGQSIDPDEVAQLIGRTIQAVIEENPDRFRGPEGPATVPSREVLAGMVRSIVAEEMAKIAGEDRESLNSRLSALENRKTRVILTRNRKVIDDEEYPQGKPLIIDLEKILQYAKE
jgi:hypothetical protein